MASAPSKRFKKIQIKEFNKNWYYKKNRFAFKNRFFIVNRILNQMIPKLILDAGTGDGELPIKLILRENFDNRFIGLDISKDLLKIASRITKMNELSAQIQFINADIEYLPFKNNTYDLIICTAVLEHVFNQETAVGEISRTCKNKKFVIITIPNFVYHHIFRLLGVLRLRFKDSVCEKSLRIERLEKLLVKDKLNIIFRKNFVLPLPNSLKFIEKLLNRLIIKGFHLLLNQLLICKKVITSKNNL